MTMWRKFFFLFSFLVSVLGFSASFKRFVEPSISYRYYTLKQRGHVNNITVYNSNNIPLLKPTDLEKINRKIDDINLLQVGLTLKWLYDDKIYFKLFGSYGKFFTDPREEMNAFFTNMRNINALFIDERQSFNQGQFAVDLEATLGFLLFRQSGFSISPDIGIAYTILKIDATNNIRIYSFLAGLYLYYTFDRFTLSMGYHFYPKGHRNIDIQFLNQTVNGTTYSFESGKIDNGNTYGNDFSVGFEYGFATRWSWKIFYKYLEYVTHQALTNTCGGQAYIKNNYNTQKVELSVIYTW